MDIVDGQVAGTKDSQGGKQDRHQKKRASNDGPSLNFVFGSFVQEWSHMREDEDGKGDAD